MDKPNAVPGDSVTVTYKITNTGSETITSVVLTDPLTGEKYPVGDLAPGQTATVMGKAYVVPETSSVTQITKDVTVTVQTGETTSTITRTGVLGISVSQKGTTGLTKTGESNSVATLVAIAFLVFAVAIGTGLVWRKKRTANKGDTTASR